MRTPAFILSSTIEQRLSSVRNVMSMYAFDMCFVYGNNTMSTHNTDSMCHVANVVVTYKTHKVSCTSRYYIMDKYL